MSGDELLDCSASEVNFCQRLHYKRNCKDAQDQVDGLRCHMRQLLHSQKMRSLSLYAANSLLSKCAGQYMNLMDSSDTISGVCNYAEEALSLARLKKNEVDRFESSLTVDSVASLPSIKSFFTNQQNKCTKNESTKWIAAFIETLQANKKKGLDLTADGLHGCEIVRNSSSKYERFHRLVPQSSVDMHNVKSSCSRYVSPGPTESSLRNATNLVPTKDFSSLNSGDPVVSGETNHTAKRPSVTSVLSDYRAAGMKRKHYDIDLNEGTSAQNSLHAFRTAREQLILESNKSGSGKLIGNSSSSSNVLSKKSLGTRRGGVYGKFVPPLANREPERDDRLPSPSVACGELDDRLKNIEEKMIELIKNEIMDHGPTVSWNDIAGLEFVKKTVKEIVVLPMLRPDIFTGLRGPPKGLLLFGPPGTGKTLIGKCIASNSKSTFFSISASSLTSKWIGEGEKMVRALFAVARCHQPAVIFIDEIDSLLTQRSDTEHESSRRMKTEFLVQLDGATTNQEDKLLVVGATNRPQELDEAARRRLVKRLYVPLPELEARMHIIINLLNSQKHSLKDDQIRDIAMKTEGYSGADMANLCKEASLGPIRCLSFEDIEHIPAELVRPISYEDFLDALHQVKASVSENDLRGYVEWNNMFGSTSKQVQGAHKAY